MKKGIIGLLTLVMLLGLLAGCGSKPTTTPPEKTTPPEEVKLSGSVTVYSPHPADPLNAGVKEFQEKTGITVNVVAAGTGELLKRVEAEKDNPQADVFWGGGAESLAAYAQYFEAFTPDENSVIAAEYKDPNSKWVGDSPLPMVIMYNKKLVSEADVPKSWGDLLDPKWKGKIAYADPAKSGSSYTILATIVTAYGKDDGKGWDFIKKLVANLDGKLLGSSSGTYKGISDGEYSVGMTLEKNAQEYVKAGADVGFIYPSEGTSAVPDGVCLVKGGKNVENAKAFINFVLSSENQKMMAEQFNRRPVRTDLQPPTGLIPLADIKLVDYDFDWAANSKAEIMEQWKNILIGK